MSGRGEDTYRKMEARYTGKCDSCEEPIDQGDDIAYRPGELLCRTCAEDDYAPFLVGEWAGD